MIVGFITGIFVLLILNVSIRIAYPVVIHVLKKLTFFRRLRQPRLCSARPRCAYSRCARPRFNINLFSSSSHVMHAHVMHSHGMHTQDVHCMLYVRINSGMPTPLFQVQYYSKSWHVATNQQHQAYYRPRVIQTIGMSLNKLLATCRLLI